MSFPKRRKNYFDSDENHKLFLEFYSRDEQPEAGSQLQEARIGCENA